jgi:hypothetical protein
LIADGAWILAGLLLAALLAQHLLLPLVVWKQQWMPARYRFPAQELDGFIAQRAAPYLAAHRELQALGFQPVAASHAQLSHVTNHFALYRAPHETCIAMLMSLESTAGEQLVCDFTQVHADGVHLSVVNTAQVDVFPAWWRLQALHVPDAGDIAALYDAFRRARARRALEQPVALAPGRELEEVAAFLNDQQDAMIARGLLAPDTHDGRRGLTRAGAYRVAWRCLWPGRAWLQRKARQRARRWLGS